MHSSRVNQNFFWEIYENLVNSALAKFGARIFLIRFWCGRVMRGVHSCPCNSRAQAKTISGKPPGLHEIFLISSHEILSLGALIWELIDIICKRIMLKISPGSVRENYARRKKKRARISSASKREPANTRNWAKFFHEESSYINYIKVQFIVEGWWGYGKSWLQRVDKVEVFNYHSGKIQSQ